ncbi:MAG TPA: S8 family serine peptidase [Bryobacteraceae bacterium]|nr:S8 family serine peptidase [Bryobacteraceae bacterium]
MDKAPVDAAVRIFGVAGRDVIVVILDRGIDWKNHDFRNIDQPAEPRFLHQAARPVRLVQHTAGAVSRRGIMIDFTGAAGRYVITLTTTAARGGKFNAVLNTVAGMGQFLNPVVPGYTIWDGATACNNITPNDYALREKWADAAGVVRTIRADRIGDLWEHSGIGPTHDGRIGIDVNAPGNSVFATLAPKSTYGTSRGNQPQDGAGFYTLQNAVSGASPQVTGIIGLMLELNPTFDAKQGKAPPGLFSGVPSRSARPGDTVLLFGTGCGPTVPARPSDRLVEAAASVSGNLKRTIGGKDARASFVGLSASGLCQVNAEVPDLPPGDAEVILQIDEFVSADGAVITVQ